MDLSGHDNCNNNRPDLTIPMPSCLVAGAMAAAAAAAAQDHKPLLKQQNPQQQNQLILSSTSGNNGNASTTIPTAAAAAATPIAAATPPPDTKDPSKPDAGKNSSKAVRYRECLKNHAAGIGGHALDGCGEFMPNKEDESSMLCAACDCHRNFHRREVEGEKPPPLLLGDADGTARGVGGKRLSEFHHGMQPGGMQQGGGGMKKRFRTKFSNEQKERMFVLSEKLGWRIQKHDEAEVAQFCADTGVKRHVLKVWMHNNKHTFGNKRLSPTDASHDPT